MLSIALGLTFLSPQFTDVDVTNWFKSSSLPLKTVEAGKGLEDMEPLLEILKDVEVVGMGESTHGSREIFQMKHRMFEFLVTKMGYRVFALEASLPDCIAMDRYVTTGQGDPAQAVQAQGFWTWATEEVLGLIKWMRAYNEKNGNVLRVVGVDMQNQENAVLYIEKTLKKYGIEDVQFMEGISWEPLTPEEKTKLLKLVGDAKEKAPPEEDLLLDRVAIVVQQASDQKRIDLVMAKRNQLGPIFVETLTGVGALLKESKDIDGDAKAGLELMEKGAAGGTPTPEGGAATLQKYAKAVREYGAKQEKKEKYENVAKLLDFFAYAEENKDVIVGNNRDKCMADNLEWAIKTYLPGQKAMLWAHNYHVSNSRQGELLDATGSHLTERFKEKYYPVGFSFYEGSFQARSQEGKLEEWTVPAAPSDSIDAVMHRAGKPIFFSDFGKAPGHVKAWLSTEHRTRTIGALYNPAFADRFLQPLAIGNIYRGMIFISKTTRARPLK